jgi:hypothetical protein
MIVDRRPPAAVAPIQDQNWPGEEVVRASAIRNLRITQQEGTTQMRHADQQGTTRRTMLRTGAAAGTAAALGATGIFAAGTASAATTGKISRLTAIYDSSLLSYPAYQPLAGLAAEAPLS